MTATKAQSIAASLAHTKWHFVHKRVRSPLYQNFLVWGLTLHLNPSVLFPYEVKILHRDGEISIDLDDFNQVCAKAQEEFCKNYDFLLYYIRGAYALNKKIDLFALKLERKHYENVNSTELVQYWNMYTSFLHKFTAPLAIPLYIEEYLEIELKNECTKAFVENNAEAFQVLTTPMKLGVIQREEENLLEIAVRKKRGKNIERDIQKHLREYGWIKNNKFDGSFYSAADIEARAERLAAENPEEHLAEYIRKIKETKKKFKGYRNAFKGNKRALAIIDTLQESIFFRSWRTERYYRNAYFMMPFFAKTAEMLKLENTNDLFYLTSQEIISHLKDGSSGSQQKINERKVGYVLYSDTKEVCIFSGKEADYFKNINMSGTHAAGDIKGQTAYPGVAKGPARIVTSIADLGKVQNGDILVSLSTTPDYVPVLKKVRAIVTEEGGVLSHASVISRELHIPCIIGTKIATKVLKDGDMIEVDAGKGVVKIIK